MKQTNERKRLVKQLLTFVTSLLLDFSNDLNSWHIEVSILTILQDPDIKECTRERENRRAKDGKIGQGAEVRRRKENGHGCL